MLTKTLSYCLLLFTLLISGARVSSPSSEGFDIPFGANLDPQTLNIITLGHKAFYDDIIYIWALNQLTPLPHEAPVPLETARRIVNVAARIEPRVDSFYIFTAYGFLYQYHSKPDALRMIDQGLKVFPKHEILTTIRRLCGMVQGE